MEMAEKLENLNRTVKSTAAKLAEKEREVRRLEEEEERVDREFWEGERKKHAHKVKLADDIFRWGREFSQSEEYKRLLNVLPPDSKGRLYLYAGGWGHTMKEKEYPDCWSKFYLQRDGTFHYQAGLKWGPCGPKLFFSTPKELAKLSESYLNKLHQFIVTGEVYESLSERIDSFFKSTKGHPYCYGNARRVRLAESLYTIRLRNWPRR